MKTKLKTLFQKKYVLGQKQGPQGTQKNRGAGAAHAASRGSSWNARGVDEEWAIGNAEAVVENARIKAVGGMTAAAHGIVDDSAFEIRLMGGFAVLKDGRDPLYTMQAAANIASVVVLAWTMVALMIAWRDGGIDWWWLLISMGLSGVTGLVITLENLLSHDAELLPQTYAFCTSVSGRTYWLAMGLIDMVDFWFTRFTWCGTTA
jgi:hypothetical protein